MTESEKDTKNDSAKVKEKKADTVKKTPKSVEKKKPAVKEDSEEKKAVKAKTATKESGSYFEAVGRRKTAVARVRLFSKGTAGIVVNDKDASVYFPTKEMMEIVESPLEKMKVADKFRVIIKTKGGGIHSQAEASRHGISRALIKFNAEFRKRIKKAGFLTRDQRAKERKKFGLKKARKRPQWSKR